MDFQIATEYRPQGDQPRAIAGLTAGLRDGEKHQVLLGVTGSGKTFTMAKICTDERSAFPSERTKGESGGSLLRPA